MVPTANVVRRSLLAVPIAAVAVWGAGCGGGDTIVIDISPPNGAPVVTSAIPAHTIAVGDYVNIGLSSYFSDPDGDALTYEANSSGPAVARASVTGTLLTVEALSAGATEVTVTARDAQAAEVRQVLEVLACIAIPDGALHWWPGDGTGADLVGGVDAALMNGATYAEGLVDADGGEAFSSGEAFSFDGVDAIGHVPDAPTLNPAGPFSIMAWAKPRPAPAHSGAIIGKGRPWDESWLLDSHNGRWRAVIRGRPGLGGDARVYGPRLVNHVWAHLAMTWDGEELAFYVDGEAQGTTSARSMHESDGFVGIGARSEEGFTDEELALEFPGEIDEVMFFGRALDDAEIRAMHDTTFGLCKVPADSAQG